LVKINIFIKLGQEDYLHFEELNHEMIEFSNPISNILKISKENNLKFNFLPHAGETLLNLENLYDAYLLNAKRIGHGYNLFVKFLFLIFILKLLNKKNINEIL
jgi:hypothetical protein